MSDETIVDQNGSETADIRTAQAVEEASMDLVHDCMRMLDKVCVENKFEPTAMIYMSVKISAHLMARNLFMGDGPQGRANLKVKMLDNVSEILDSAAQHIDQSERELNSKIIRPN